MTCLIFSSKCTRTKVKTRKKVSVSLRCPHEVIVAALDLEENLPLTHRPQTIAQCTFCHRDFEISSGGKCVDCKSQVCYCSKKCQVNVKILTLPTLSDLHNFFMLADFFSVLLKPSGTMAP